MSTPFLGQVQAFAFGVVPRGWATCSGQLLPIAQNQPLFALLGTIYGGDGRTNFALPDLRGDFILGPSTGIPAGTRAGEANHTLTTAEMPSHAHPMVGSTATAAAAPLSPVGNFPAVVPSPGVNNYGISGDVVYGTGSNPGGGGQPHPNQPPYLAVNYCIALQGMFPSRG